MELSGASPNIFSTVHYNREGGTERPLASIEDVLEQTLRANGNSLWLQAWRPAVQRCLATAILSKIDLDAGSVTAGLSHFDDPAVRAQVVIAEANLQDLCIVELLKLHASLNAALVQGGFDQRSGRRMERHLRTILPGLIQQAVNSAEITANPFPVAWNAAADLLAQNAYYQSAQEPPLFSETRLHNTLLLSGFFLGCQYSSAADVEIAINQLGRSMLSVRGSAVRIVENVSASGVEDQIPRLSTRHGAINLHLAGLSDLLQATVDESEEIAAGNGVLHRVTVGSAPAPPWLMQARDTAYRQYEYTLLGYMALASIEQLIRAWASARGVDTHQGGRPRNLAQLIPQLGCTTALQDRLKEVCNPSAANIRGRVMHGGLLEVETQRSEALLKLTKPAAHGYRNPFSPENICQLCLECLQLLDQEASAVGITEKNLEWSIAFWLTTAELETGCYLYSEFLDYDEQAAWWNHISMYLRAVAPNVKQFFSVGFMGWMGSGKDRLVRFMAAVLIFETLYRATAQLHGIRVLQISGDRHIQYRMLDDLQLCAPEIMDVLTRCIPTGGRPLARRVLELAVKARNAFAHGALTRMTKEDFDRVGNLVVKSVQALIGAGIHHMTGVAAYYHWQKTGSRLHDRNLENWLAGEDEIYSLLGQLIG